MGGLIQLAAALVRNAFGGVRRQTTERLVLDAIIAALLLIAFVLALVLGIVALAEVIGLKGALAVFVAGALVLAGGVWILLQVRMKRRKAEMARQRAADQKELLAQAALVALPILKSGRGIAIGLAVLGVLAALASKGGDDTPDDET